MTNKYNFICIFTDLNINSQYVGCFIQDNAFRKKKFELSRTNTPSTCAAICNYAAYKFAEVLE